MPIIEVVSGTNNVWDWPEFCGTNRALILDEPTNGLDPQGIKDVRQLINTMRDNERNVILASHLISGYSVLFTFWCSIKVGSMFGSIADLKVEHGIIVDSNERENLLKFYSIKVLTLEVLRVFSQYF